MELLSAFNNGDFHQTPKIDFHGDLDIFNVIYSKYDDNISFFDSYMGLRCDERISQEKK